MCGLEGHGAFQTFPGGKLKGDLKCTKHRNFVAQLAQIKQQYSVTEDQIKAIFWPNMVVQSTGTGGTPPGAKVASPILNTYIPLPSTVSSVPVQSAVQTPALRSPPRVLAPPGVVNGAISAVNVALMGTASSAGWSGKPFSSIALPAGVHGIGHGIPTDSAWGGSAAGFTGKEANGNVLPPLYSFEIFNEEEYGNLPTLQFAMVPNYVIKDSGDGKLLYRGNFVSSRGTEDVSVKVWRKPSAGSDITVIKNEVAILRALAASGSNVAHILHSNVADITYPPIGGVEFSCIICEYGDFGYLDQFLQSYVQANPGGLSTTDVQTMSLQLIDTLIRCHDSGICHKDLKPQSIIVTKGDRYQSHQFSGGRTLKLCDFLLSDNQPPINDMQSFSLLSRMNEKDKFAAPEHESEIRSFNGNVTPSFFPQSDVWSLGCILYYIGTNGQFLFESHRQARDAIMDADARLGLLGKHGLQDRSPMLYDLIERMMRPLQTRCSLKESRCHPFLWSSSYRKKTILDFANACNSPPANTRGAIEKFMAHLDNYGQRYVFDSSGWTIKMNHELLEFVQPKSLRDDYWWSGRSLLQAIYNQISFPEAMHATLYSSLSYHQMMNSYLRQIVDNDFPKLLILMFELGRLFGKWNWDSHEITHEWNINISSLSGLN